LVTRAVGIRVRRHNEKSQAQHEGFVQVRNKVAEVEAANRG